jgi:hypothetical protein
MPAVVLEPFEVLWQEVVHLHYRYKVFKQLYADGRRVDLLNEHAEGFFGLNQQIWIESIILGLSRILDDTNGTTGLRVLVKKMSTSGPHQIVDELKKRLEELETLSKATIEAHRNNRIAHLNARFHPSGGKEDPPPLTVENIEKLFTDIAALMNVVGVNAGHGTTVYDLADSLSDGDTLIFALRKADRFDELFPDHVERWGQLGAGRYADLDRHR